MLIARIHPVISIYRIRGGQYAYSGNVINFEQHINKFIKKLPTHPSKLPSTLVFNKKTSTGTVQFRVRASKVYAALKWLKSNNIYYKNIEIDTEVINSLPENGDVSHLLKSLDIEDDIDEQEINQVDDVYNPNNESKIEVSYVPILAKIN